MAADDLIAALCAGGRVDSHGDFTLDREKAREKLRTFQVAEPHRYVQNLVALAVLRGAPAIAFTCDSDDLWARFAGAPLTAQDFEDLYSSAVAAASGPAERARQQLAIGINAALALDPRHVRVTSGPPGERVRLTVRPGTSDVIETVRDRGEGTAIHVKLRLRPRLVGRFARRLAGGALPEVRALRERCEYAEIEVTLNGARVSRGLDLSDLGVAHAHQVVASPTRACVAGLRPEVVPEGELRVVRHGVWISTLTQAHWPRGTIAVLRDDDLITDLSSAEVVRGGRLDEALSIAASTVAAVTCAYLQADGALSQETRSRLWPALIHWPAAFDATTPFGQVIRALPWFRSIFGEPVTFADLQDDLAATGGVSFTGEDVAGKIESFPGRVVYAPTDPRGRPSLDLMLLRKLFGDKLRDRHRELELEVRRAQHRKRWLARPVESPLPGTAYAATAQAEASAGGLVSVAVGLRDDPERALVRLIAEGCLIAERALELPLPLDLSIAGLRPNTTYDGAAPDGALAGGLIRALDLGLELVEARLRSTRGEEPARLARLAAFLRARHDPEVWRSIIRGFELPEQLVEQCLATVPGAAPRICRAPGQIPLGQIMEPWICDSLQVRVSGGPLVSLGAIAAALERGDRVGWVRDAQAVAQRSWLLLCRPTEGPGVELVERLFGDRIPLVSATELAALVREEAFLARPEVAWVPAADALCAVEHDEEGRAVILSLRPSPDAAPRRGVIRVVHRGRLLSARATWMPIAGVEVLLNDPALRPTEGHDDIVADQTWEAALCGVLLALPRLVEALVRAVRAGKVDPRALIPVLTASVPAPIYHEVWRRLSLAEGAHLAAHSYMCLLALHLAVDAEALAGALAEALRKPRVARGREWVDPITELDSIARGLGASLAPTRGSVVDRTLRAFRRACGQEVSALVAKLPSDGAEELLARIPVARVGGTTTLAALRAELGRAGGLVIGGPDPRGLDPAESGWSRCFFGPEAFQVATAPARREAVPTPQRPTQVLVEVELLQACVRGRLWLPTRLDPDSLRVVIFSEAGLQIRAIDLFGTIPVGGSLAGPGILVTADSLSVTKEAGEAILVGLVGLYDALLKCETPEAQGVRRELDLRIGTRPIPSAMKELRAALATKVRAEDWRRQPAQDDLTDVLKSLEELARRRGEAPEPPVVTSPPTPPHLRLPTRGADEPPPLPRLPTRGADPPATPPTLPAPPPSPPPGPSELLRDAVRRELHALRQHHDNLLSSFNLGALRVAEFDHFPELVLIRHGDVVINSSHALISRAAEVFADDPVWVDFLASLVFSAYNLEREDISDADELHFHGLHLQRVTRRVTR